MAEEDGTHGRPSIGRGRARPTPDCARTCAPESTVYAEAELAPLWEPLLGEEIALAAIFELAERITARYRGDGYILSRAIVPPQSITDGVVRIAVVEGWVSRVLIEGDPGPERLVREIADRIAAARPLRLEVLERSLLLIGDLPGLDVESVLRPSPDEPGAAELVLLARHRALSGELGLSNRGTRFAGRPELSGELRLASALGRHDRTRLRGVINPAATEELRVLAAEHEQPIGSGGTGSPCSARWSAPARAAGWSPSMSAGARPRPRSRSAIRWC